MQLALGLPESKAVLKATVDCISFYASARESPVIKAMKQIVIPGRSPTNETKLLFRNKTIV